MSFATLLSREYVITFYQSEKLAFYLNLLFSSYIFLICVTSQWDWYSVGIIFNKRLYFEINKNFKSYDDNILSKLSQNISFTIRTQQKETCYARCWHCAIWQFVSISLFFSMFSYLFVFTFLICFLTFLILF